MPFFVRTSYKETPQRGPPEQVVCSPNQHASNQARGMSGQQPLNEQLPRPSATLSRCGTGHGKRRGIGGGTFWSSSHNTWSMKVPRIFVAVFVPFFRDKIRGYKVRFSLVFRSAEILLWHLKSVQNRDYTTTRLAICHWFRHEHLVLGKTLRCWCCALLSPFFLLDEIISELCVGSGASVFSFPDKNKLGHVTSSHASWHCQKEDLPNPFAALRFSRGSKMARFESYTFVATIFVFHCIGSLNLYANAVRTGPP